MLLKLPQHSIWIGRLVFKQQAQEESRALEATRAATTRRRAAPANPMAPAGEGDTRPFHVLQADTHPTWVQTL